MNLIVTDQCNRSCPYCFAQEKVRLSGRAADARILSFCDYSYCLDFLRRSGILELKVLGGEPTLHPEFSRMITEGIDRKFKIRVFSNGLWSDEVRHFVEQNPSPSFCFLLNINEPGVQSAWETDRQARSMAAVGGRASLGFNIYRSEFDLRFVIESINRFGLKRELRLGIAHPIVGHVNEFVDDVDLPDLGERLLNQMEDLEKEDILVALDCGFPLCMFREDQLGRLVIGARPGRFSQCQPVLDVGPDLTVWPCFPLSGLLNANLRDYQTASELRGYYEQRLSSVRSIGFIDKCLECRFRRRGQCCGGCIARTLRNWEQTGDRSVVEKLK